MPNAPVDLTAALALWDHYRSAHPDLAADTELLLKSRRVIPSRLTDAGFTFDYPQWRPAAADLAARRRRG